MDINAIDLGRPGQFNVLVEISTGSANKYELDEQSGFLKLDFVYKDGFRFPFNYGSVPHTRAEDGDPVDACVFSSHPIPPNVVVEVKPIAILKLKDRGEQDNKIIAVPVMDPLAKKLNDLNDLTDKEKTEIVEFFKEVGVQKHKTMDIEGLYPKSQAMEEIKKYRIE